MQVIKPGSLTLQHGISMYVYAIWEGCQNGKSKRITYQIFFSQLTKGQLISKGLFDVIVSTKKPTKFLKRISALDSKRRSDQKTLLYNHVK